MLRFLIFLLCPFFTVAAQSVSQRVYEDAAGHLRYFTDSEQNRIPDFSQAGYKNGEVTIPEVPVVLTVSPVAGDNTAHLQAAIDAVGDRQADANGIRGTLLLLPGRYPLAGTLRIPYSGVVLRGSGQGADPAGNTVLVGTGTAPANRQLIIAGDPPGSTSWTNALEGTRTDITSPYIPVGSRTLEVSDASRYAVGDNVIVFHPSTEAWLASINFGDVADDDNGPWRSGRLNLYYNRYVTAVNPAENKVILDVPVYDHLDRSLAQAELYKLDNANVRDHIGIENLRIEVESVGPLELGHVRTCILLRGVDNSWVTDVTGLHFSYALVNHVEATRTSILRCSALEPHSPISGGLRYNFAVNQRSNNILFSECFGTEGRHTFVANGASQAAGIVWTDSESERDYSTSEGHRRWSQALLFDNLVFREPARVNGPVFALWNRGDAGTAHGWSSVHSVGWNVTTPLEKGIVIQQPPGRQNYCIGCGVAASGNGNFTHPPGVIELTNQELAIPSLYDAQLEQRLAFGVAPDGPARLTLTQTDSVNTLGWLDIAGDETGYVVEVSADGGATFTELASLPANATTYAHTDPGPTNSLTVYRVYAVNDLPSAYSNQVVAQDIFPEGAEYFDGTTNVVSTGGSAAQASTFTRDETCGTLQIAVTDPAGSPAPPFGAYMVKLEDAAGNFVSDYTNQLNVTFRVRSAGTVTLGVLFRSGAGTTTERTSRKEAIIPCDLSAWTEVTFSFDSLDFGADFAPDDVRDIWFYLDRGTENFGGNEFYIDHIVAGGLVPDGRRSTCDVADERLAPLVTEQFTGEAADRLVRDNAAALATTITREPDCGWVQLSVTDPANAPLAASAGYQLSLTDAGFTEIDLSTCVRATMRVWSAATVDVQGQFLVNGTGSRWTVRKSRTVVGGGAEWKEIDFVFDAGDAGGADLSQATDFQFYLDFGTNNFAGNLFLIDDIIIGGDRDTTANTTCAIPEVNQAAAIREHFLAGQEDRIGRGSTAARATTFTLDDNCEFLRLSVTDPVNTPLPPFNAYIFNLRSAGATSVNLAGNLTATLRMWSAETVEVTGIFRSGDGAAANRSARLSQTVTGGGNEWTEISFTFTDDDIAGLDPGDVIDFWFYLNLGEENFPGNEVIIDDITVGGNRDPNFNSPCDLGAVSTNPDPAALPVYHLYPTLTTGELRWTGPTGGAYQVADHLGRRVAAGKLRRTLDFTLLPSGMYYLLTGRKGYVFIRR